jgi:hypothetical protein
MKPNPRDEFGKPISLDEFKARQVYDPIPDYLGAEPEPVSFRELLPAFIWWAGYTLAVAFIAYLIARS